MNKIIYYTEDPKTSELYPTPDELISIMISKVDWGKVENILEPSAGKGNILKRIAEKLNINCTREYSVDAIEIDQNLRMILRRQFSEEYKEELENAKNEILRARGIYSGTHHGENGKCYYYSKDSYGKNTEEYPEDEQKRLRILDEELNMFFERGDFQVVHDDFLTYTPYVSYSLVIMNPPFSEAERHLLKAIEIQKNGGQIVCLLNAETIRNPFSATRKHLADLLKKYNAKIEYFDGAFLSAERKTDVSIALVYVDIPVNDALKTEESIYSRMAKAKSYTEPTKDEITDLEVTDFIKAVVARYKVEVESGIELINTYKKMLPYLRSNDDPTDKYGYSRNIIALTDNDGHEMNVNKYVKKVRLKYWKALLTNQKFIGRLTSALQNKYREKVNSFANYEFSEYNIYTLLSEMNTEIKAGIESEIFKMYDRLTEEHAYYPECSKNKHLYNGWKTNKAWKIVKKAILPCYGVFSGWSGEPRTYEAEPVLSDIERILNFFDGHMTAEINLHNTLEANFRLGITKNIKFKYFTATFYKKGTVHIVFDCPELIDRYNIFAAQGRKWLPPSYGKKKYADMDAEEKAVIDSFQGEKEYNKVVNRPDYYLAPPVGNNLLSLTG